MHTSSIGSLAISQARLDYHVALLTGVKRIVWRQYFASKMNMFEKHLLLLLYTNKNNKLQTYKIMATTSFKKSIKNFIGKAVINYGTQFENVIKVNNTVNHTLTGIYRFVLTLPIMAALIMIVYAICVVLQFMADFTNAVVYGIGI